MSPATISYAKRIIRSITFESAKQLAEKCLACPLEDEIINEIEKYFKDNSITRTRNII